MAVAAMALTDLELGWLFAMGRAGANEGGRCCCGRAKAKGWVVVVLAYRFSLSRNKKSVLGVSVDGAKMEENESTLPAAYSL